MPVEGDYEPSTRAWVREQVEQALVVEVLDAAQCRFERHTVVAGGEIENLHPVGPEPGEAQPDGGFELVPFLGVVRALRVVSGGDGESLCRPQVAEHLFTASAAVGVCGIQGLSCARAARRARPFVPDFFRINKRGGCFVLGRSDATLNRHGVRIGTAEVYAVLASVDEVVDALIVNLDLPGGRFFMPLFVRLADGLRLDDRIEDKIRDRLRREYTPRHVPERIVQVPEIPVTLTGKKMEVPVRKILLGAPADAAANRNAMANPGSLDFFADYAATQQDYPIG
jgi:hypothetical protein